MQSTRTDGRTDARVERSFVRSLTVSICFDAHAAPSSPPRQPQRAVQCRSETSWFSEPRASLARLLACMHVGAVCHKAQAVPPRKRGRLSPSPSSPPPHQRTQQHTDTHTASRGTLPGQPKPDGTGDALVRWFEAACRRAGLQPTHPPKQGELPCSAPAAGGPRRCRVWTSASTLARPARFPTAHSMFAISVSQVEVLREKKTSTPARTNLASFLRCLVFVSRRVVFRFRLSLGVVVARPSARDPCVPLENRVSL